MFPWCSEYELHDLPDWQDLKLLMAKIGNYVSQNNIRLEIHPGAFNCLASHNPKVVANTKLDLLRHAQILDALGLPQTYECAMNIHVGGSYGDKQGTAIRWLNEFKTLPYNVTSRLVLENDDKLNSYSIDELITMFHDVIGIPITFDELHYQCHPGTLTRNEALTQATNTWRKAGIRPGIHWSSSRRNEDGPQALQRAHSYWIHEKLDTHTFNDIDIMLEVKGKEIALLDVINENKLNFAL